MYYAIDFEIGRSLSSMGLEHLTLKFARLLFRLSAIALYMGSPLSFMLI